MEELISKLQIGADNIVDILKSAEYPSRKVITLAITSDGYVNLVIGDRVYWRYQSKEEWNLEIRDIEEDDDDDDDEEIEEESEEDYFIDRGMNQYDERRMGLE